MIQVMNSCNRELTHDLFNHTLKIWQVYMKFYSGLDSKLYSNNNLLSVIEYYTNMIYEYTTFKVWLTISLVI